MSRYNIRRPVYSALLIGIALLFSYIEFLIPFDFGIPGVKIGFANIAIVSVLYLFDFRIAFAVQAGRILLSSLLFGNLVSFSYSISGGLLSLIGMMLLIKVKWLKMIGVSSVGGLLHNIGQLAVAIIVTKTIKLGFYLPVLAIAGIITGLLVGIVSGLIVNYFPKSLLIKAGFGRKINKRGEEMEKVYEFLKSAGVYYLATVDNNQPRVRPFGTVNIVEGKLYIQTGKSKPVSKQISENPLVEICAFKDVEWIRVSGELVEDDRVEAKKSMLDSYPDLRAMYNENDSNTQVLYFKNAVATVCSFTKAPEIIRF